MFKKLAILTVVVLAACGEDTNPHANFPRVQKGPATLTRSLYIDSVYRPVEKQFFTYDDLGRITNHKIYDVSGDQQSLVNEIKYLWGEGKNLISVEDKDTKKLFTYSDLNAVIPRIKNVTVQKLVNGDWKYDHELAFSITNEGKLEEVFKYSQMEGGIAKTKIENNFETGVQTITEYLKIGSAWTVVNIVKNTYNEAEPNHLHGLKITENSSSRTDFFLNYDSAATGWEKANKLDGNLVPKERAFINASETAIITRVEELDADKLIWNPSYMIEIVYTDKGSSLLLEGPWQTDVSAESIISKEFPINFIIAYCV